MTQTAMKTAAPSKKAPVLMALVPLTGQALQDLTGAVSAYYDTAECRWKYVPSVDVENYLRRGEKVRVVYVMEA